MKKQLFLLLITTLLLTSPQTFATDAPEAAEVHGGGGTAGAGDTHPSSHVLRRKSMITREIIHSSIAKDTTPTYIYRATTSDRPILPAPPVLKRQEGELKKGWCPCLTAKRIHPAQAPTPKAQESIEVSLPKLLYRAYLAGIKDESLQKTYNFFSFNYGEKSDKKGGQRHGYALMVNHDKRLFLVSFKKGVHHEVRDMFEYHTNNDISAVTNIADYNNAQMTPVSWDRLHEIHTNFISYLEAAQRADRTQIIPTSFTLLNNNYSVFAIARPTLGDDRGQVVHVAYHALQQLAPEHPFVTPGEAL